MNFHEIMELIAENKHFIDMTDHQYLESKTWDLPRKQSPDSPRYQTTVISINSRLSIEAMKTFLTEFSSFHDRYFMRDEGVKSAEFLFQTALAIAQSSGKKVSVKKYVHKDKFPFLPWKQFSVIARIEGSSDSEETVILGAHQDTINVNNTFGRAPSADDDGSGTVTILEAFRVLCATPGFVPYRPIEFHWYSAEEMGIWGSLDIAAAYRNQSRPVVGMMQFDMTGYIRPGTIPVMGVVTDFTDPALTSFLKKLIESYSQLSPVDTKCGYCSDNAAWFKSGYPTAYPLEGAHENSSPYLHTDKDTLSTVSFEHVLEFAKVAVGFAVEMGNE